MGEEPAPWRGSPRPLPRPPRRGQGRDSLTAFARGLTVMNAFTEQSQSLTLADVARIAALPRATARRCLLTLQALGYVEHDHRYFSLSPQVLTIAQAYL